MDETRCWKAVIERDSSCEGKFFYGVLTTGVFCRPGCGSRRPLRENVRFFRNADEAAASGLRPCQRCRPLEPLGKQLRETMESACRYIRRHAGERQALLLPVLGEKFGMSPFHFQRQFKAAVGVTPRQYAEGVRMEQLKEQLREGAAVTDAIYEAGFGASSRVYERADASLGMTPRQYQRGGRAVEISWATAQTPLGLVMLGATDRGLCFLEFGESEAELVDSLKQEFPAAKLVAMPKPYTPEFAAWMRALDSYLAGHKATPAIPLVLHGTAFQLKVWRYLQATSPGTVRSYAELAREIGHPKAVRAVASACAANRIALLIPCHRVIRGDGGLGGYRWGLERKRALLKAEQQA